MKQYEVTLWSLTNPCKAVDEENPQTFRKDYIVEANTQQEAREKAAEIHPNSIWESDVQEL
jgi:hypothetical protein